MNISNNELDDLDSLIDSINVKKDGKPGVPPETPGPEDESKVPGTPGPTESPELSLERNEAAYEPIKPTREPAPKPLDLTPERLMERERIREREREMRTPTPMRPSPGSRNRTIMIVSLFLVLVLFFFILRRFNSSPAPVTETPVEKTVEITEPPVTGTDASQAQAGDTEGEKPGQPTYEMPEDALQGRAPLMVKPDGPVFSAEIDPEIAAAADALKIRVRMIQGSSTKTMGGVTTTMSSGTFLGFKVTHTLQQKGAETVRDEITVITPSRGVVTVKGNILDAMKKIDYQTFLAELQKAGLEVIKNPLPAESIMNVQLRLTGSLGQAVNPDYLIGPRSVGPIELGMPIKKMEALLSKKYEVVAKRMPAEDGYYDTAKVLDPRGQPLFFVIGSGGKVVGIQVVGDKFKTSRGIGIGNKLGEFRVCYLKNGKATLSSTIAGIPFVATGGMTARFFLQGQGLDFVSQVFPDDLKISDILVGNSPFVK